MTAQLTGAVDYKPLDAFKRAAQQAAAATSGNLAKHRGLREVPGCRGESAYLLELEATGKVILAHVHEGLGTKNLVADAMAPHSSREFYDNVAQCTVATGVNDCLTSGALPVSVTMHLAVGDTAWFDNEPRWRALLRGWQSACNQSGCVWGGGETPQLKDIVVPESCELSVSVLGIIEKPEQALHESRIQHLDDIYVFPSSGIHANGLTDARRLAARLPQGYLTKPLITTYGEALLAPTVIYADVLRACFEAGIDVHYAVNVTGHGWRKLMRPVRKLTYLIDRIPPVPHVLKFIQRECGLTDAQAYATFNMGAGFVLYVNGGQRAEMEALISRHHPTGALQERPFRAGVVVDDSHKRVLIRPNGVVYAEDDLDIR